MVNLNKFKADCQELLDIKECQDFLNKKIKISGNSETYRAMQLSLIEQMKKVIKSINFSREDDVVGFFYDSFTDYLVCTYDKKESIDNIQYIEDDLKYLIKSI